MNLVKNITKKINGTVFSLASTGVLLLILGILVMVNALVFRILLALFIFLVAYVFLYGAFRLWGIKKEIDHFFKK